ncbi:BTB/POZ domain-containing protein At1g04390 isoform X2 [Macadamia integrifolia]|uniref:BTB/POZ domain-containing protein At1g04390 isoform X2 n=1 Tax=Macadamia integrifolia TaxID=60698 RepID=UPI001C52BB13|nr:BTB/POZ domain-containing protein At1g04390 isoform X2 [Macadamia integrifolia]
MKSSKQGAKKNRCLSDHALTLHQRLYQALNLGIKSYNNRERKWRCADVEIQRLALRSISAFLDCISSETSELTIVKDSINDMLVALEGILQSRNEAILRMAINVTMKLVDVSGNSILQYNVVKLVHPLASLLSFHESNVVVSCSIALNQILSKLSRIKRQEEICTILRETNTIEHIVCGLLDFATGTKSLEYFQEMASLLTTILWRWPPFRYPVWSNGKLLEVLGALCIKPDSSVAVVLLPLYSALASCGAGAMKLLENGEALLPMLVRCMGCSQPDSIRMEAFKLAQGFARSQQGCLKMMSLCCEPIVQAIVSALSGCKSSSGKIASYQVPLLVEACRLALITRWAGVHHNFFWKLGVHQILLDLLLSNSYKFKTSQHFMSTKDLLATVQEGLDSNQLLVLRPYIWDILGWLTIHCQEAFNPDIHGCSLNVLISCACLVFVDAIHSMRQVSQSDISYISTHEPISRAVFMMIYSPCQYIVTHAKNILSEVLMPNEDNLEYLLRTLKSTSDSNKYRAFGNIQIALNLMGLACYSGLSKYQSVILKSDGIKILLTFIRWCLKNDVSMRRLSIARHLHHTSNETICCCIVNEDWEGEDILLFFSLWVLAELVRSSKSARNHQEVTSGLVDHPLELESSEGQILISMLQQICGGTFSAGPRWYASYILSYFGCYGFPNKLGKRIGEALNTNELADLQLILASGESVRVHDVILMVRCPSLLPMRELPQNDKICDGSAARQKIEKSKEFREIRLSAHVDHQALPNMLSGKRPKWDSAIAFCDFTPAFEPAGYYFSDIILEAKETEVRHWTCSVCSQSVPHMHVHKIILWASCDYLRALFQSGMQDSLSQTVRVPVGWEALWKLVRWFYSDGLPKPITGCLWDNMDLESQLHELQPYIELCWLSEFWFLEDVQENCSSIVASCLKSSRHLSFKVISFAAQFSQWKIVEIAANCMAPLFPHLRDSGELEALDEGLVDMVRAAYVQFSQVGAFDHSE